MSGEDGGPAFPLSPTNGYNQLGMTLRDYFASAAIQNPSICTGVDDDWQLTQWFGKNRTGITKAEIATAQAFNYADAMLKARTK